MPIGEAFGSTRMPAFDAYLRTNAIPISGLSQNGDAPEGITISYLPEATVEQQAWAENAKAEFDWRKRRPLTMATVQAAFFGLTSQQKLTSQSWGFAALALLQPDLANAIFTNAGISVPIDEVDPTETVP